MLVVQFLIAVRTIHPAKQYQTCFVEPTWCCEHSKFSLKFELRFHKLFFLLLYDMTFQSTSDFSPVDSHHEKEAKSSIHHSLLCSTEVIRNQELLIKIEGTHNIKILTKDYSMLPKQDDLIQPDVLIDERHAILLFQNFGKIREESVHARVISSAMKCEVLHLLICCEREEVR